MSARDIRRRANNAFGASAIAFLFAAETFVTSRLNEHPATPLILAALILAGIAAGAYAALLYRRARAAEAAEAARRSPS